MKPGITAKLFVAFVLTCFTTAVAVGFGVRTAFDQGFEKYIEEREDARRARLAAEFASAYREHGSWDFMRGDDRQWIQLNSNVRPSRADFGKGLPHVRPARPEWPGGPMGELQPGFGGGSPPRSMRPPPGVVLDENGQRVVGDADVREAPLRKEIIVNGRRVGWVAFAR